MGCYIWYSEEGPGHGHSPPRPLLTDEDERSTGWSRGSRVTPGTDLGLRQLRGHGHKELVRWRRQAGAEGRQTTQGRSKTFEITPRACITMTMTSSEMCSVSKQLAGGLQVHHSAGNCLASCLYNDGVVQAVTFAYLIY